MSDNKIISIIGGKGAMGQKFAKAFRENGCKVLISDIDTKLSNREVAARGDIIIITVPIHKTFEIIREISGSVREGSLITDFTSVKVLPMNEMKKSFKKDVNFIGGHPLFGPSTDFLHQHFILCGDIGNKTAKWYKKFLQKLGLKVLHMTQQEHDRQMATIQCLTHFSTLSLGSTLEKMNYDLQKGEKIATPVYLMRLYGVGRILAQDPDLYADMQMYNPYAKEVIANYKKSVDELYGAVEKDNIKLFHDVFAKSQKYFGTVAKRSMKITDKLIKTLS